MVMFLIAGDPETPRILVILLALRRQLLLCFFHTVVLQEVKGISHNAMVDIEISHNTMADIGISDNVMVDIGIYNNAMVDIGISNYTMVDISNNTMVDIGYSSNSTMVGIGEFKKAGMWITRNR